MATTVKDAVKRIFSDLVLTKDERKDVNKIQSQLSKSNVSFPQDETAYPLVAKLFDIFFRAYGPVWQRLPNREITEKGLVRIIATVEDEKLRYKKK